MPTSKTSQTVFVIAVGLTVGAICARLGFWQLDRLGQRRAWNTTMEQQLSLPPLDIAGPLPDSLRFRRVAAGGSFDFDRQVIEVVRSLDGLPGVYVVTPLRLSDGRAVLVERGWAYAPDAKQVDLASVSEPAVSAVQGIVVTWEPIGAALAASGLPGDSAWPRYVRSIEPVVLAASFPYPILPGVVRRIETPSGASSALRAIPAPVLDDGPHLSYAIQWFSFAAIAVVGSVVLVRGQRGWRGQRG